MAEAETNLGTLPAVAPATRATARPSIGGFTKFTRSRFGRALINAGPPSLVFIAAIVAWEVWVKVEDIKPYLVPPPTSVFWRFVNDYDVLWGAFRATATSALLGYAFAIVVGFAVSILFAQSKLIQRSFYPFAIILQTTPIVATAPLIIVWAGTGRNAIVIITFIITVFPIIANSTVGLMSADHNMRNLFAINNANRVQELWKLRVPYAMPYVVSGLKISAGLSVIGAIVGEFFAGTGGADASLGSLITFSSARLHIDMLFAAGLCASGLGIAFFTLVSYLGNYALRNWHESAITNEN